MAGRRGSLCLLNEVSSRPPYSQTRPGRPLYTASDKLQLRLPYHFRCKYNTLSYFCRLTVEVPLSSHGKRPRATLILSHLPRLLVLVLNSRSHSRLFTAETSSSFSLTSSISILTQTFPLPSFRQSILSVDCRPSLAFLLPRSISSSGPRQRDRDWHGVPVCAALFGEPAFTSSSYNNLSQVITFPMLAHV